MLSTTLPMLHLTKHIVNEVTKFVLNFSTLISPDFFLKIKYYWRRSWEVNSSCGFPVLSALCLRWEMTQREDRWMSYVELCLRWEVTQDREQMNAPCCDLSQRWKWPRTKEQGNWLPSPQRQEVTQNISVCWRVVERFAKKKHATAFRLIIIFEQK